MPFKLIHHSIKPHRVVLVPTRALHSLNTAACNIQGEKEEWCWANALIVASEHTLHAGEPS